jgi:chromosome partitioning protein
VSRRPRVVTIVNQKGGAGKTTTAVHLAAACAETGARVLVVDLDQQCNATTWLDAKAGEHDVLSVLLKQASVDDATVDSVIPGVQVLPATSELAGLERHLGGSPGAELRLRSALQLLDAYDIVFIDCPPSLGLLSASGLAAATDVLVPVAAGSMELEAVGKLADTVTEVGEALNPGLTIGHVLVCAADLRRRLDQDVLAALERAFPDQVMHTVIGNSIRVREAYSHAQPVTTYDPTGKAAQQYRAAAAELTERMH